MVTFEKIITNHPVNLNYGILFETVIPVFLIGSSAVYFSCKRCSFELKAQERLFVSEIRMITILEETYSKFMNFFLIKHQFDSNVKYFDE